MPKNNTNTTCVKFRFWVPAKGWAAGGYENVHWAESEAAARERVRKWNEDRSEEDYVRIIEITPITKAERNAEFMY